MTCHLAKTQPYKMTELKVFKNKVLSDSKMFLTIKNSQKLKRYATLEIAGYFCVKLLQT